MNGRCPPTFRLPALPVRPPHSRQADLFEEIGVDSDEAVGESLSAYQRLLPKRARR